MTSRDDADKSNGVFFRRDEPEKMDDPQLNKEGVVGGSRDVFRNGSN